MEELKKALQEIYPDIDFENETTLYDDGIIDSVDVVNIISKLEETFDISVTMWEMVEELM